MTARTQNIDHDEIRKFESLASRWWDPQGEFKSLHEINPLRLEYIQRQSSLEDKRVLDVGCGGGILAEPMSASGANVTGIDVAKASIEVAKLHLLESGLTVDYRQMTAEALATEAAQHFDIVTCMEILEHVPDPVSVVTACAQLVKPGGKVFFSTINRNPKAWLFAIVGAEYVLNLLPKGTHEYSKFIRPSELEAWCRAAGLKVIHLSGMTYHPLTREYRLESGNVDVNYLLTAQRSENSGNS